MDPQLFKLVGCLAFCLSAWQTVLVLDPAGKPTVQTQKRFHSRRFVSGWNLQNPTSTVSRGNTDSITNVSFAERHPDRSCFF